MLVVVTSQNLNKRVYITLVLIPFKSSVEFYNQTNIK